MDDTFVAVNSRLRYAVLLLGSLCFVAGGGFIVARVPGAQAWIGWMSIVFFGGCALIGLWQLFDPRPRLVIDGHGVFDRTLGVGVIPWADIVGAELAAIQGHPFVCLELRNPEYWLGKLSPWRRKIVRLNQGLGFAALNLNLSGVAADPHRVMVLILRRLAPSGGD